MKLRVFTYATLLLALCCGVQVTLYAQAELRMSLDSATILLGDHLGLTVDIVAPPGTRIQNIEYGNWADEGKVELLDIGQLNTVAESPQLLMQQRLLLTTFDTGYLRLPQLLMIYEKDGIVDTVKSGNLGLQVTGLAVLEEAPIRDNKGIIKERINWRDILPYVVGFLVVAALLWFIWRQSAKIPEVVEAPPPPPVPAHEIALDKLAVLEQESIWEQGEIKLFQTELTYVLREYLENRFAINALEATTPEIAQQLKNAEINVTRKEQLRGILDTADMVKFAKAEPPVETHPIALAAVKTFVTETKRETSPPSATEEAESNTSDL